MDPAKTTGAAITLNGSDNYGKPRQEFADTIAAMDESGFVKHAEQTIWLSAFANNNPRSDYHWMADACYTEANRRGKPELYSKAYDRARRSAGC